MMVSRWHDTPQVLRPRDKNMARWLSEPSQALTGETKKLQEQYEAKYPSLVAIRDIPHLQLDISEAIDMDSVLRELAPVLGEPGYQPFIITEEPRRINDLWTAKALINLSPDHVDEFWRPNWLELAATEHAEWQPRAAEIMQTRKLRANDMQFYKTQLWDRLPTISSYISRNISDDFYRVHIGRLSPHGFLTFHNHRKPKSDDGFPYGEIIVHLALITDQRCTMYVRDQQDDDKVYGQHYAAGQTWLFNSWLDHAADCTQLDYHRVHLTMWCRIEDDKFRDLLERSLIKHASHVNV